MIEVLAAILLSQGAREGLQPDVRLEAFKTACAHSDRRDYDRAIAVVDAAGWLRVADDDHPELAASLARARAEADDPELPMTFDYVAWGREIEGRRLYVVMNRTTAVLQAQDEDQDGDGVIQPWERRDVMTFLGCGVWDFDATEPVHPGLMTAWVGSVAVQTIDEPGVVEGGVWNVHHMMPGTGEVKLGFVPDSGTIHAMTGFSGVAITLTTAPEPDPEQASGYADGPAPMGPEQHD